MKKYPPEKNIIKALRSYNDFELFTGRMFSWRGVDAATGRVVVSIIIV